MLPIANEAMNQVVSHAASLIAFVGIGVIGSLVCALVAGYQCYREQRQAGDSQQEARAKRDETIQLTFMTGMIITMIALFFRLFC